MVQRCKVICFNFVPCTSLCAGGRAGRQRSKRRKENQNALDDSLLGDEADTNGVVWQRMAGSATSMAPSATLTSDEVNISGGGAYKDAEYFAELVRAQGRRPGAGGGGGAGTGLPRCVGDAEDLMIARQKKQLEVKLSEDMQMQVFITGSISHSSTR